MYYLILFLSLGYGQKDIKFIETTSIEHCESIKQTILSGKNKDFTKDTVTDIECKPK